MRDNHYDLIVIGSGPGGASLGYRLAPTGIEILTLEHGNYLPPPGITGIRARSS
ncbi:MAG: NAD(P)-binding protein [Rhodanobacteraceae bacterium]